MMTNIGGIVLTHAQADAMAALEARIGPAGILYLTGASGTGKSTVLRHLVARRGGRLLTASDAMAAFNACPPAHLEEALLDLVRDAFARTDFVAFDDWLAAASFATVAPDRPFYLFQALATMIGRIAARGGTFVASAPDAVEAMLAGAPGGWVRLPMPDASARRAMLEQHLGRPVAVAAMAELALAYRDLDGHQLSALGGQLRDRSGVLTGADLLASLDAAVPPTNVRSDDVEDVGTHPLIGGERAIETLERTVIVPTTQPELAATLGLRVARGVLLLGAPGTGKTTLGRLLAHRMAGRFFLIDGTMFADGGEFSQSVGRLLARAAASSPSVVFIDDADMIFRNGQSRGFARQLLSKLDGLASESQREVCLVMTAMDLADMPPAIIRSGRVDVWIEMTLPDAAQRVAIVTELLDRTTPAAEQLDTTTLATVTAGFTPADLRTLVNDASGALAYDLACDAPTHPFDTYITNAADEIAARKRLVGV